MSHNTRFDIICLNKFLIHFTTTCVPKCVGKFCFKDCIYLAYHTRKYSEFPAKYGTEHFYFLFDMFLFLNQCRGTLTLIYTFIRVYIHTQG